MNHIKFRFQLILSLLLALVSVINSQAASLQPEGSPVSARSDEAAGAAGRARSVAQADGPVFPDCAETVISSTTYSSLQVFLLIDDSSSMLYSDPTRQRLEGVKNVLDILAKEYYLPAVDASANDPSIKLPDILVSLIHFSSVVRYNSGWKTINPQSNDDWTTQLKAFEADLAVKIDYNQPQATDFRAPFQEAARLAAVAPQTSDYPRLVMLFTDGVPNLGLGNLKDQVLTDYMKELQGILQSTFNRRNDLLFVTEFGSDALFFKYWNRVHKQLWEEITQDSAEFEPRRVLYVPAPELASRMERIIGFTIGRPVDTLTHVIGSPQQYTTEIPDLVDSLRLTYYTSNTAASFAVTGPDDSTIIPDGKNVILTGANTSIQVLEILNPTPGSYHLNTTAAGGSLTRLLRIEKITAKLFLPLDTMQQLIEGPFGIQLFGADGKPLVITDQMNIQAAVTQAGQFKYLEFTPENDTYKSGWMPLTTESATVDACATLVDSQGTKMILYYGPVGEITIDPVTVRSWEVEKACVPTDQEVSVPLQLYKAHSETLTAVNAPEEWAKERPTAIDALVQWTSTSSTAPGGTPLDSKIEEEDAKSGEFTLRFKPDSAGDVQFAVTASAIVDGVEYPFYDGTITVTGIEATRHLALTLNDPTKLADRLSVTLYRWFHPGSIGSDTVIVYGRHVFDWFGTTRVQISGRLVDTDQNANEPGIERFALRLVSASDRPSSERLNTWTAPEADADFSTLEFPAPGLGLYNVIITDLGQNPSCTALSSLPTRTVLLVNDFWEYLIILILILILALILIFLLKKKPKRSALNEILLVMISIFLIALDVGLIYLLVTQTYKKEFTCNYLVDQKLGGNQFTLCEGIDFQLRAFTIDIPDIHIPGIHVDIWVFRIDTPDINLEIPAFDVGPFLADPIRILRLKPIDGPLEAVRWFISWNIVLLIAVVSLVIAFIASKILGFINLLRTPEGRTVVLTNLSILLLFFVILSSLFYFRVVR